MYNRVLVPLDGSKRAEKILPHVQDLARRYDATVIFVQVVEPVPATLGLETPYEMLRGEYEQRVSEAEHYLADLEKEFHERGIRARTSTVPGPVVGAIVKSAEREDADLIAMASHGRSGLSQVFYGSVAAGVLHRIDRPLLLIRSRDGE